MPTDLPVESSGVDLEAAKKKVKRTIPYERKVRDHGCGIQGDGSRSCVRVIIWQEAAARCEGVQCIRNCQLDLLDSDFQDVTWLGTLDVDRASQNVYARPLVFDLLENVTQRLFNLVGLHTCACEALRA